MRPEKRLLRVARLWLDKVVTPIWIGTSLTRAISAAKDSEPGRVWIEREGSPATKWLR